MLHPPRSVLTTDQLSELKPGDLVTRMLAAQVPMAVMVTALKGNLIHCGPWTYHPQTGCEVDHPLGWDGVTRTGSYLTAYTPSDGEPNHLTTQPPEEPDGEESEATRVRD